MKDTEDKEVKKAREAIEKKEESWEERGRSSSRLRDEDTS